MAGSRRFRDHLRRDPFAFGMVLSLVFLLNFMLFATWWLVRGGLLLALGVISLLPVFALFYLRSHA